MSKFSNEDAYGALDTCFEKTFTELRTRGLTNCGALIYHYTSLSGLLGIIDTGTIWATHSRFLNDAKEFEYAREVAFDEITKLVEAEGHSSAITKHALGMAASFLDKQFYSANSYVACFSLHGDQLSQWRGYAKRDGTFAIGFDVKALSAMTNIKAPDKDAPEFIACSQVCYDEADLRRVFRGYIHALVDCYCTLYSPGDEAELDRVFTREFVSHFTKIAAFYKSPGFREECEIRLLAHPAKELNERKQFIRAGMIVPYVPVQFIGGLNAVVREIVVGPGVSADGVASLRDFLMWRQSSLEPKRSTIPYRELAT